MNNSVNDSPQTNRKLIPAWPILGAFIFFLVLLILGYPHPWTDDLFYNGAALNMAGGGDFSNPLLIREVFPSHYFLVYPPIHPYACLWLAFSLWHQHLASMLAFQNLMSVEAFIIAATMIYHPWSRGRSQSFIVARPLGSCRGIFKNWPSARRLRRGGDHVGLYAVALLPQSRLCNVAFVFPDFYGGDRCAADFVFRLRFCLAGRVAVVANSSRGSFAPAAVSPRAGKCAS